MTGYRFPEKPSVYGEKANKNGKSLPFTSWLGAELQQKKKTRHLYLTTQRTLDYYIVF